MRLSIRNQLPGVVQEVERGNVMATVRTRVAGGIDITAAITLDAVEDLELDAGTPVTVVMKSTEVAVATGPVGAISIRNRIPGVITEVEHGSVMSTVKVATAGDRTLTAVITRDAAVDLDLQKGMEVTLLVKSTEVSIGRD